jgi:hypothetical protein|tara:strand:+ start:845 stop:1057 length:213 start_codon:yes stop_codon:yes gene_type:complete
MATVLGITGVSAANVARLVAWGNRNAEEGEELTAGELQTKFVNEIIMKVKKWEKAQSIAAADHESNFDLV